MAQRVSSSRIMCQNGIRVLRRKELLTGLVAAGATSNHLVIVPGGGICCLDERMGIVFDTAGFHEMNETEESGTGCVPSACVD